MSSYVRLKTGVDLHEYLRGLVGGLFVSGLIIRWSLIRVQAPPRLLRVSASLGGVIGRLACERLISVPSSMGLASCNSWGENQGIQPGVWDALSW